MQAASTVSTLQSVIVGGFDPSTGNKEARMCYRVAAVDIAQLTPDPFYYNATDVEQTDK